MQELCPCVTPFILVSESLGMPQTGTEDPREEPWGMKKELETMIYYSGVCKLQQGFLASRSRFQLRLTEYRVKPDLLPTDLINTPFPDVS